ncbi:MAG: hypothetical protein FWE64_03065 [Alphaproteobacteria bacterium]|nr:hypothetical protein [Alphaproteobacteria bacterium]
MNKQMLIKVAAGIVAIGVVAIIITMVARPSAQSRAAQKIDAIFAQTNMPEDMRECMETHLRRTLSRKEAKAILKADGASDWPDSVGPKLREAFIPCAMAE